MHARRSILQSTYIYFRPRLVTSEYTQQHFMETNMLKWKYTVVHEVMNEYELMTFRAA